MSSINISVGGGNSATISVSSPDSTATQTQYRYYYDHKWWREGVRDGKFVRDYLKTGGNQSLFLSGGGVEDTDYINTLEES